MSMLRLDDRLLGRFRIDARIAEGGMGVVYRGFDLKIDQPIAIKVLRPEAIENAARFEREATMLATLDHPGVLRYIAHGVAHEGSPFLVVEWIEGITLAEHLERVGLTPAESIAIVRRLAEALGTAHARGLVHRDVKPENVLLADGDLSRAKVIDFGLVRHASGDQRLTETGAVVGTPGYMAPEQARGDRDIDARTDVFALGCVLYECLTGMPAFSGRNAAAVMARIVLCDPPALRDAWPAAPAALERLVHRMLAKRPADRPVDASSVADELADVTAPDAPRRRRTTPDDAPTTVASPARVASYVIFLQAGDPGAVDGSSTADWSSAADWSTAADWSSAAAHPSAADWSSAAGWSSAAARVSAAVRRIVAPFGANAHALADGTIVVVLYDAAADEAAACTLALRDGFREAPIVLIGPDDAGAASAPLAALLETGAEALELADLHTIFGGATPALGAIRIDATTAARLAPRFDIREDANTHYLIGRS